MSDSFFDEQSEQSLIKANIVTKYFDAWAQVIIGAQNQYRPDSDRIAYIDLFAGPGRYKNGAMSTPMMILEKAVANPKIRERIVAVFNDKDEANVQSLRDSINSIKGLETLKHAPQILNNEVGTEMVRVFEGKTLVPTFFFVDPWGYRGLSLKLVNSVLKDWGCDCIFFFNYNRINMGLSNDKVKEHMDALFGETRADQMRKDLEPKKPSERELLIVEELCQALKTYGTRFTLPFGFKDARGKRTTHHLIFVSKAFKGYEIMKEIMAKESSSSTQGVASFEYSPADALSKQSLLFSLTRPLDDLTGMLLETFAGRKLKMKEIYEEHNVDTPYIKRNYKEVLKQLEEAKKITASEHKKGTMGDDVVITFPGKR